MSKIKKGSEVKKVLMLFSKFIEWLRMSSNKAKNNLKSSSVQPTSSCHKTISCFKTNNFNF